MHTPNQLLVDALVAPLLEPELSGVQIGRNRITVIKRLSEFLDNAMLQVWLVEQRNDHVETRLGYWYPVEEGDRPRNLGGQIVITSRSPSSSAKSKASPSPKLWKAVQDLFEEHQFVGTPHCFPIYNPIPIEVINDQNQTKKVDPIAWVFAATSTEELGPEQYAAAKALTFHLAILLQYGRTNRMVESTKACTSLLYQTLTLNETFTKCAEVLATSCAAQGAGYLEFIDGKVRTLTFVGSDWLSEIRKKAVEQFVYEKIQATPTLDDVAISVVDGREIQSSPVFGNFLYIPIMGPSLCLESCGFVAITEADDVRKSEPNGIGVECETPSHALFLLGKRSPAYLGVNFSETDKALCRSIARELSGAVYSRFFEELFLSQARYFSSLSSNDDTSISNALRIVRAFLPGVKTLHLIAVIRDAAGIFHIDAKDEKNVPLPSGIRDLILVQAQKVHSDLTVESTESAAPDHGVSAEAKNLSGSEHFKNIQCACYSSTSHGTWLVFQMSTRYEPLRFYALELGSNFLEKFRFHLLKHFMRELYHLHRTKDSAIERSSLLAQIRHAVVNPIAASTNNIDTFQRHLQLYGRTDEGWLRIKNEKEMRDLIPHAIYLNNQALLFINSGRFLFSSIGYGEIKFRQYRPLDLLNEVRLAFSYGLQERNQVWNLKIVGDSNQNAVGDNLLLWIVLANLIDNAIKYGHRDTEIAVKLEFLSDRWIFSIENTGDYLSPSLATKIFRPFERGDSTAPNINRRHGTGLGVTVSEMILRAHSDAAALKYTSAFVPGEQKKARTQFLFEMPYKISRQGTERGK